MKNPKVFIIHRATIQVAVDQVADKHDLSPAKNWGILEYILEHNAVNRSSNSIMIDLKDALEDFTDADALLCTGDPAMLVIAGIVLERYCPKWNSLRVLKWDKYTRNYKPYYIGRIPGALNAG